jgi:hypothetical protein
MASLEFARHRPASLSHARHLPTRAFGADRSQRRLEYAIETGRTMLILMLVAAGIVGLRYVLVVAYGFLQ